MTYYLRRVSVPLQITVTERLSIFWWKCILQTIRYVCLYILTTVNIGQVKTHTHYGASRSTYLSNRKIFKTYQLLLLPLTLQPAVGFGLYNNTSPLVPIYHQLSPSSHSQHLKISFYFFFPFFPGSSSSSRLFQFLSEDLFGHPVLLHSLQVTQSTYPLPLYPFYYIFSFIQPSSSWFVLFSIPHLHI